jgi:AcrR family transcriptional regulator
MNIHSVMARRTAEKSKSLAAELQAEGPKRQAILDAALELFAERGFHGTAVPLVAERAGVGAGTVYRYFASKEALVNELYQVWKQQLGRAILEDFPLAAPTREQFHELWRRMHQFAAVHPRALAFLEFHHHRDYLDARSRNLEESVLMPIREFIVEAQRKKVLRPGAPEMLFAVVYGTFVALLRGNTEGRITLTQELLDATERTLWDAIKK